MRRCFTLIVALALLESSAAKGIPDEHNPDVKAGEHVKGEQCVPAESC